MSEEFFVVAEIADFGKLSSYYAERESRIDFRREKDLALLCTMSFCAMELKKYIGRIDSAIQVIPDSAAPADRPYIRFSCRHDDNRGGGFAFRLNAPEQLEIIAEDRNGLINGTYEFLRLQGFRWLEPGESGEYRCSNRKSLVFPAEDREFVPSFKYRAFYFEFSSQENVDFLLWMARNRMNVYGTFADTAKTAQKFGFWLLTGGHILTKILNPYGLTENGRRFYDEHRDWYGVPENPAEKGIRFATSTQFCCSNSELMDFIAEDLIFRLSHQWKEADILEISGFDTWGSTCQCEKCAKFPTDSDKYLNFMREIRIRLDEALKQGRIEHPVMLNSWAYEGTATMYPPENPIPKEMGSAHDNNIAFVINRCYKHVIDEPDCSMNADYFRSLKKWGEKSDELALWVGEYYGVSRHVDMPLLFTENMQKSMQAYHDLGARGITYMHTPIINWGCVGMTQMLHAELAWDIRSDWKKSCREFLELRYGDYASEVGKIYEAVERASENVAEWRSWHQSILRELLAGRNQFAQRHYASNEQAVEDGYAIARIYEQAGEQMERLLRTEQEADVRNYFSPTELAENPEQMEVFQNYSRTEENLALDMRQFHYGWQVMQMMALLVHYHTLKKQNNRAEMENIWENIDALSLEMQKDYAPISYRAYTRFFAVKDVLTRSLLRPLVAEIRKERMMQAGGCNA